MLEIWQLDIRNKAMIHAFFCLSFGEGKIALNNRAVLKNKYEWIQITWLFSIKLDSTAIIIRFQLVLENK